MRDLDELLETAALFAKLPAGTGAAVRALLHLGRVGHAHGRGGRSRAACPVPILRGQDPSRAAGDDPRLPDGVPTRSTTAPSSSCTAPVEDRKRVFDLLAADPNVDVIVVGLTGALGRLTDRFAEDIVAFADDVAKPIVVTWNSFKTDEKGFTTLVDAGHAHVPVVSQLLRRAARPSARYQEASRRRSAPAQPLASRLPKAAARAALAEGPGAGPVRRPTRRGSCSRPSACPWPGRAWPTRPPRRRASPRTSGSRW